MTTTPSHTTPVPSRESRRSASPRSADSRQATAAALEALRCEQELIECHDGERGPLLLDAASSWFEAGHIDRAVELLSEARLLGGDAGRAAQLRLARIAFDRGHRHEALGTLRWLADKEALGPFDLVGGADLLRENGEPEEALEWYDRVLAGRAPHQVVRSDCPWVIRAAVAGRARARADLGLTPDALDRTATIPAAAPVSAALTEPAPSVGPAEATGHAVPPLRRVS